MLRADAALDALLVNRAHLTQMVMLLQFQLAVAEGQDPGPWIPPDVTQFPAQDLSGDESLDEVIAANKALRRQVHLLDMQLAVSEGRDHELTEAQRKSLRPYPLPPRHRSGAFDLLDDAAMTRIASCLTGKDAVRLAVACKRLDVLETRSTRLLRHGDLIAFFTTAEHNNAAAVAWLNDNQERLSSANTINVSGAPLDVMEALLTVPHLALTFHSADNSYSALFDNLEWRLSECAVGMCALIKEYCIAKTDADSDAASSLVQRIAEHGFEVDHDPDVPSAFGWDMGGTFTTGTRDQLLCTLNVWIELDEDGVPGDCEWWFEINRCSDGELLAGLQTGTAAVDIRDDSNLWLVAAQLYMQVAEFEGREWESADGSDEEEVD